MTTQTLRAPQSLRLSTTASQDALTLAGRVLLALLFIPAGYQKIGGFTGTAGYIGSVGLPLPEVGAALAIAVELGLGLLLLIGWRTRIAALGLAGFTLAASVFFHNYWGVAAEQAMVQQLMFFKNIAIVGGLLAIAAFGAGGFLYVMVAHHLVRILGERGLCTWGGTGLGIAFAAMALAPNAEVEFAAIVLSGVSFYMFHNTLQTNGTQMAPEARGAGMALFALCLFVGQAIGVPIAAPIVDRWGAPPVFWAAAVVLPLLAFWFSAAIGRRAQLTGETRN